MNESSKRVLSASSLFLLCLLILVGIGMVLGVMTMMGQADLTSMDMTAYNLSVALPEFIMLAIPIMLYMVFNKSAAPMMRFRNPGWGILLVPVTAFAGFWFVLGLSSIWQGILMSLGFHPLDGGLRIGDDAAGLLMSVLVIGLVPAVMEEIAFRGIVMPAMGWAGKWGAIAISGLLFALLHGSPSGIPGHLLLGLVMGFLALASGSIWVPILYHLVHNASSVIITYGLTYFMEHGASGEMLDAMNAQGTPLQLIGSGLMIAVITGVVYGLLLWLSWIIFKKQRLAFEPVEREHGIQPGDMPHLTTLLPLLAGFGIVQLLYLTQYLAMAQMGMGGII